MHDIHTSLAYFYSLTDPFCMTHRTCNFAFRLRCYVNKQIRTSSPNLMFPISHCFTIDGATGSQAQITRLVQCPQRSTSSNLLLLLPLPFCQCDLYLLGHPRSIPPHKTHPAVIVNSGSQDCNFDIYLDDQRPANTSSSSAAEMAKHKR